MRQNIAAWGLPAVQGRIVSQQKCPLCQLQGAYAVRELLPGRLVLLCQCGQFHSDRPEIRIGWKGSRYRITRDKLGRRFNSYLDAERALAQINDEISNTNDPDRRGPTFNPGLWVGRGKSLLWEIYLAQYLKREESRCTVATFQHKRSMARHLAWFNGRNVRAINAGDLADFEALPCIRLALAPKTRADLMQILSHIFRQAVLREDLDRAPQTPRVEVPRPPVRWMNKDQQTAALEKIAPAHRPIFLFLFEYGARVGEACGLCWDCIDLPNQLFYLARTWTRRARSDTGTNLKQTTKGKRSTALPIMPWLEDYLTGQPVGIGQAPVFKNPNHSHHDNPTGYYTPDFLNTVWRHGLVAAGLEHIALKNATRHSAGNQRLREGWSLQDISYLLCHASTRPTETFYVKSDAERVRGLMEGKKVAWLKAARDNE